MACLLQTGFFFYLPALMLGMRDKIYNTGAWVNTYSPCREK